ncbi:GNAT family N-acetyltransferase [Roseovarius aestuariivivens]|uniref:GNAT family N-acetyltransferase n=1 Tax=Roseovarius aestuariivivens TaxID=1888910 RepID=UPI001FDA3DA6|nr:GNAT family N-acetyltransferase [Roseovarius aestuariivivens]
MAQTQIRPVEHRDLEALEAALRALGHDLGDPYRAGRDCLGQALFGATPSAFAQIAGDGPQLRGAVLFSPVFSTMRGGAGLYVSDLWVEAAARGSGLGRALLQSAVARADSLWNAGFLRLAVYGQNTRARQVYDALGFTPVAGETVMLLAGEAFQQMRRPE